MSQSAPQSFIKNGGMVQLVNYRIKVWLSNNTDKLGREKNKQRSSQEVNENSGGAAKSHGSGGTIYSQDNYTIGTPQI